MFLKHLDRLSTKTGKKIQRQFNVYPKATKTISKQWDSRAKGSWWRLYVTNAPITQLTLSQAVMYYRDEWLLERGFHYQEALHNQV